MTRQQPPLPSLSDKLFAEAIRIDNVLTKPLCWILNGSSLFSVEQVPDEKKLSFQTGKGEFEFQDEVKKIKRSTEKLSPD